MLILARKIGQSIVIAGETEVTVVEVRGDQVRLGITAPRHIAIHRKELLTRNNGEASSPADASDATSSELDKSA